MADDPAKYQQDSVWYGSGIYIINGKKVRMPVTKINKLPMEEIRSIKSKYDVFAETIDYKYFDEYADKFIKANADRYNYIACQI